MNIEKRILIVGIILCIVLTVGIAGYSVIEKGWTLLEALYMTVITVATVGFMEVKPLSDAGRIFTIFLIFGGATLLVYAGSSLIAFVVEGELTGILGRRKMEKQISQLNGHYIVCGAGKTGRYVVEEFLQTRIKFVVIESNIEQLKKILGFENLLYIQGDATSDATLRLAGIEKAKGLVSALPEDKDNLFVTLTAKSINPNLRIVAKAAEEETGYKLKIAGASSVVSPNYIGGLRMASETIRPTVTSFLDIMLRDKDARLRITETSVGARSKFVGQKLGELGIRQKTGALVLAIKKGDTGGYIYNPPVDEKMQSGDTLIVMATPEQMEKLKEFTEAE